MMEEVLRLALIDDHAMFRDGLRLILKSFASAVEFSELSRLDDLDEVENPGGVGLVLLDYHLPDVSGLEGLIRAREVFCSASIVVISGEEDPATIRRVIENGASGFIPKSSPSPILVAALRLVVAGGTYLPPEILPAQSERGGNQSVSGHKKTLGILTERQREVLKRAIQGKANKVIAREMNISDHTVKVHLSVAFKALGVKNRTEAVYAAAELGIK